MNKKKLEEGIIFNELKGSSAGFTSSPNRVRNTFTI